MAEGLTRVEVTLSVIPNTPTHTYNTLYIHLNNNTNLKLNQS